MSTENKEWREDSKSENTDVGRGSNRSYNREGGYSRPSYNHEGSDRPYRSRFNSNSEDRPQHSYGDRPQRPSHNREDDDRPYHPRFNNEGDGRPQRSYGDRPQRPSYSREGGDRPYHPRFSSGGDDRPQRSYGGRLRRPSYNREGGDRPYRPRFDSEGGDRLQRSYDDHPQRPLYNREGGDRPYRPRFNNNNRSQGLSHPVCRTGDYNPNAKYSKKKQIRYREQFVGPNEPIHLNKFLANTGVCFRREAGEFITAGMVSVNGEVVTELGIKIKRANVMEFHDEAVSIEHKVCVLSNKSEDCMTTSGDPQARLTAMGLMKGACAERIYPVGRLDRNTTDVLLLTNDGDLASKLTHPKYLKKKIYHIYLDKNLTKADTDRIAVGIQLKGGEIHADAISCSDEAKHGQVGIEIHPGRNRIVHRIFGSLGYKAMRLSRIFFAGLTRKGLRRGEWRYLTGQEVNFLRMGSFE